MTKIANCISLNYRFNEIETIYRFITRLLEIPFPIKTIKFIKKFTAKKNIPLLIKELKEKEKELELLRKHENGEWVPTGSNDLNCSGYL